jgi:SAM-dependent methyltransferase
MRSPIYWHRLIYRNTYGRSHPAFEKRFKAVAELIEPGASVLDICCGDARLYTHYLQPLSCPYTGVDLSLSMAPHRLHHLLIKANAWELDLPAADYVVMMEALYHFYPRVEEVLRRLRAAARKKVIVLEQVQNKIGRLPRWLTRFLSDPGNGSGSFRFARPQLEELVRRVDPEARMNQVIEGYDLLIIMGGQAKE